MTDQTQAQADIEALKKATDCLYLVVDESVADDVRKKAEVVIQRQGEMAQEIERLKEAVAIVCRVLQPTGSPPPGDIAVHINWIVREAREQIDGQLHRLANADLRLQDRDKEIERLKIQATNLQADLSHEWKEIEGWVSRYDDLRMDRLAEKGVGYAFKILLERAQAEIERLKAELAQATQKERDRIVGIIQAEYDKAVTHEGWLRSEAQVLDDLLRRRGL